MRDAETFYWKNENGEIKEHHISEFRTFLERGSGSCVSFVEFEQSKEPRPERTGTDGMVARDVLLPRDSTEEEMT